MLYSKVSSILLIAKFLSNETTSTLSEIPLVTINFLTNLSLSRYPPSWAVQELPVKFPTTNGAISGFFNFPGPFEDYLFPASFYCRVVEIIEFLWLFFYLTPPHTHTRIVVHILLLYCRYCL